jgi:hypothetical protein
MHDGGIHKLYSQTNEEIGGGGGYDGQSESSRNSPADRMRDKIARTCIVVGSSACLLASAGAQCLYCSV